jgi:hypothetical protein
VALVVVGIAASGEEEALLAAGVAAVEVSGAAVEVEAGAEVAINLNRLIFVSLACMFIVSERSMPQ